MFKFSDRFEKVISAFLIGFAMVIITYQVVQLIWNSVDSFTRRFKEVGLQYSPEYGKTIAILFFNVLLMMEIMQTIKVFSHSHIIKVRIILIVCLIAASRKILELGEGATDPMTEFGLAALIFSLSAGYFLVSRYTKEPIDEHEKMTNE
jgi:uncharacterized membrane protein (DUF373 family)